MSFKRMVENGFDIVWSHVPHVSYYQIGLTVFVSFTMFISGLWLVLPVFTHYTPAFTCQGSELGDFDQQCHSTNNESKCTEFAFSFNGTGSINDDNMLTLVSSFSLVCDLAWVAPFMISIKGAVGLVGALLGSFCSDAYGRRVMLLAGCFLQTLFAVSMSTMPNWWSYAICDCFVYGIGQALYLTATVYVCEILGPSKRHLAMISSIMFSLGYVFVSLLAWCLPKWNHLVGCVAGITGLYIPICLIMPESPQYLWVVGRVKHVFDRRSL